MLFTRLAQGETVVVIDREQARQALQGVPTPVDEKTAVLLGTQLEADYVLFGSLTVFGESISTDARFMDVHQNKPVVTFNQYGKTQGDVIRHIDIFAGQINANVFGRQTASYQPTPPPSQPKADVHAHPDKLWTGDTAMTMTDSPGALLAADKTSPVGWKSRNFKSNIKGVSVGDVDGDGINETVFISDRKVFVYRYMAGRFEKLDEIDGQAMDAFIGVDVADINGNGKSEIFITNLFKENRIHSFVLEWDGATFARIVENENWYYRVLNVPKRGDLLVGQKRGLDDIFTGGVYALQWENGRYIPMDRQKLPKSMNVYGFAYGDVKNEGRERTIALTKDDYLQILNTDGKSEWKSDEQFGRGATYLEFPMKDGSTIRGGVPEMDRYYLPLRILVDDLDKDGKTEIVVAKNKDATGFLARLRVLNKGHIECLTWDNMGLVPIWRTRTYSKYISDYVLADMDNDGHNELVYAVVSRGSDAFKGAKSFIVSQDVK
jgi:TolB-like protein